MRVFQIIIIFITFLPLKILSQSSNVYNINAELNEKDKIIGQEIVRKEEELIDNLSIKKNKDYDKFIKDIL